MSTRFVYMEGVKHRETGRQHYGIYDNDTDSFAYNGNKVMEKKLNENPIKAELFNWWTREEIILPNTERFVFVMAREIDDQHIYPGVLDTTNSRVAMMLNERDCAELNANPDYETGWAWTAPENYMIVQDEPEPVPAPRLKAKLVPDNITQVLRIRHANGDEVVGFLEMYVYKKETGTYAYSMRGSELAILEDDDVVEVL